MQVQNRNRKIYADYNIHLTEFVLYMDSFIKHGLPFFAKKPFNGVKLNLTL